MTPLDALPLVFAATFAYFLLFRAEITRPLWSRLDPLPFIGPMGRCPACAGFWLGLGLALPLHLPPLWAAIYACVLGPPLYWLLDAALHATTITYPSSITHEYVPAPIVTPPPGESDVVPWRRCLAPHIVTPDVRCALPAGHSGAHEAHLDDNIHTWDDDAPAAA